MSANLITATELSERIAVSEQTLACWRMRGFGPPFLKIGRFVRYSLEDVEAWLESNRVNEAACA